MKNLFLNFCLCTFFLATTTKVVAQTGALSDELDWTAGWTSFKPVINEYPQPTSTLSGKIARNMTLSNKKTYLLQGPVYVANNSVLTIEPGTVIMGDKESFGTLIITRGSKIIAEGKENAPIIFTSNAEAGNRHAGDWGGIVLLGNALLNTFGNSALFDADFAQEMAIYGGTNDNDDSGILKYVRIEFPGVKFNKIKELNGLSLAGVGNKTTLENIQISYSNDDSYEFYGGAVNLTNVISYKCTDDDFDFTNGYNGTLQYGLAIRNPLIADFSGSRCLEVDNFHVKANNDPLKRKTTPRIQNFTFVNQVSTENQKMLTREAVHVGEQAGISVENSVISGFRNICVFQNNERLADKFRNGHYKFVYNLFNGTEEAYIVEGGEDNLARYNSPEHKNTSISVETTQLFKAPLSKDKPSFLLNKKFAVATVKK